MPTRTQSSTIDLEIKKAAQLSITEISIGSIGHGFKIPLTGQLLSLNQLAFLLNAVNKNGLPKSSAFEISSIAAILKSFSPAGQKLGPMLSIAMQGFLFWVCISIFGLNLLGLILGAIFLSLWAFIQPFITLFMIYGFDFVKLIDFYVKRIGEDFSFIAVSLIYAVLTLIIIKLTIAIGFVVFSFSRKKEIILIKENRISALVMQQIPQGQKKNVLRSVIQDLLKPLFLFSFTLMLIFVWQINGSISQKIWLSLRPLASAFVIFYILRSPWIAEKLMGLSKRSKTFERIYLKSKSAFELVTSKSWME